MSTTTSSVEDVRIDLSDSYYYRNHVFSYNQRLILPTAALKSATTAKKAICSRPPTKTQPLSKKPKESEPLGTRQRVVTPTSTYVHNPQSHLDNALSQHSQRKSFYTDLMLVKSMTIQQPSTKSHQLGSTKLANKQAASVSTVETIEPINWKRFGKDARMGYLKPIRFGNHPDPSPVPSRLGRSEAWKKPEKVPRIASRESVTESDDLNDEFEDVDPKSTLLDSSLSIRTLSAISAPAPPTTPAIPSKIPEPLKPKSRVRLQTSKSSHPSTHTPKKVTITPRDNLFPNSFRIHHTHRVQPPKPSTHYTAPHPSTFPQTPFSPPKPKTTTVWEDHLYRLAQLKLKRKPHLPPTDPEPPAELDYITRPRSAHVPFRVEEHVRAVTMVVEKEVVDDYEKRMRGLFLPSLFAGDEVGDYVGNSARDRRLRAAVVASGGAGFGGPHGGVLGGKGMVAGGVKGVTFSDKKPIVSGTGGAGVAASTDAKPGSGLKRVSGRPLSGSLMRQNGAAPRVAGAVRVPSAKGKKPGTETAVDRSRKLSTAMSKAVTPPAGAAKPRKSIATVNSNDIDVPDDLRVVDIRWDLALYSAFKQNRIKKSVLEDILKPEDETNEVRILRAKQDKIDLIGAAQVRRFYQMNVGSRNDKELDVLDSILGKYKCFAKLSPVVRYKLYNCCSIETHPRGTVVIREGHQAKYWYIILSGECLQQLRPDTPMSVTTRVQIGGSVGEFASVFSSVANETRHVRATCLMRTEFLRVEKGDFQAISREARGLDSMVFEFFTTVPAFFGVERLVLQSLCQRSIVRKFDADQVMLRAGEMCSNMYFIMRGKVRALHLVSFIKVDCGVPTTNNIDRRHKYILSPCGQNANAQLKPGDEIVRELATVLDLSNGMSFPPMKPSKVVQEQEEAAAAAEAKANGGISFSAKRMSMKPAGDVHALPCPFHFVVVDRLEVIVIAIQDLIEILPPETLKRVQEHRSMTDVSCQEIEERYMSALGWRETENSGSKTLRIDHFSKDGSWSHPVVKNKFKNHDYDPFDIPGKKSGGGTGSVGNLLNPEKRQKSLLELMVDGL